MRGFLVCCCTSFIAAHKNSPMAILAIFEGRCVSDCSSCTRWPCLAIVANRLISYKKVVAASKGKIQLLPQPYLTLTPPLRSANHDVSTPRDLYHELRSGKSQSWRYHDICLCWLCWQMHSSTMQVWHCRQSSIGHRALYVYQLCMILFVHRLLHRYGPTRIRLHGAAYYCSVRFYVLFPTCIMGRCLELEHRIRPTGVCIAGVSEWGADFMKRPLSGSIQIQFLWAEVFVEPWLAVVEKVGSIIMKSGKSWGIYSKLQVTREWMTVNLHIQLKIYPAAHSCMLQVIPTVLWFAVSRFDVICLFVFKDRLKWTIDNISYLTGIQGKFSDRKVIWWCFT